MFNSSEVIFLIAIFIVSLLDLFLFLIEFWDVSAERPNSHLWIVFFLVLHADFTAELFYFNWDVW